MFSHEKKEKWRKILLVSPVFLLYSFGNSLSGIVGRVLFVEHIGSDYLPHTYVIGAIFGSILTMFIAGMMSKVSVAKLLQFFSWLGAIIFFLNYNFLNSQSNWAYSFFLIVSSFFYLILGGTMVWRIAGNLCTFFESKGIFIFYSLAFSVGGTLGGFAPILLENFLGTEQLIYLISGSLVLAAINLLYIEKIYNKNLEPTTEDNEQGSKWVLLKSEILDFKKTRLAKLLFITLTIFNIVWWISDFEFQKIVGDSLTEEEYSKVSGLLSIVNNLLLSIALFVQTKITKKIGVLNTLLSAPSLVIISFILLLIFPIPFFAFAVCTITPLVGYSILTNSSMSTSTALPISIRNKVSTFISGNSDSIAMLLAGVGLIILNEFLSNIWIIAITCTLLLINIIVVVLMKKVYLQQVLINLGSTNQIDMHGAIDNLAERTYRKKGAQELMKLMSWRNLDCETIRKIIFALGAIENVNVIPSLLEMFKKYDATVKYSIIETIHSFKDLNQQLKDLPFTRLNILEVYENIFLEEEDSTLKILILEQLKDFDSDKVIAFLHNAINDKDPDVSTRAIAAMRYFHDRGIITYVKPYLEHPHLLTKSAAIISLWQFTELKPLLMKYIIEIMNGTTRDHILGALSIIGILKFKWEKAYVEKHILNDDETIKQAALLALMQLDDTKAVLLGVVQLTEKTSGSIFLAKSLKQIPIRMKSLILKEIQNRGEGAINVCIDNLKSTYLNFTEEIDFLIGGKENLEFRRS